MLFHRPLARKPIRSLVPDPNHIETNCNRPSRRCLSLISDFSLVTPLPRDWYRLRIRSWIKTATNRAGGVLYQVVTTDSIETLCIDPEGEEAAVAAAQNEGGKLRGFPGIRMRVRKRGGLLAIRWLAYFAQHSGVCAPTSAYKSPRHAMIEKYYKNISEPSAPPHTYCTLAAAAAASTDAAPIRFSYFPRL